MTNRIMISKKILVLLAILFGITFGFCISLSYSLNSSITQSDPVVPRWETIKSEDIHSPAGWAPCQTIDERLVVKNSFDYDVEVRIVLSEQWLSNAGGELPLISPSTGLEIAQKDFLPESGWIKNGDYYYYDVDLSKDEESRPLINSIAFNCDASLDYEEYADATYHLRVTIQAKKAGDN